MVISEINKSCIIKSDILRDLGQYSTRYTSKGALLTEAGLIIDSLLEKMTIEEVRKRAFDGTILGQRTRTSRQKIWRDLHYRLFTHRIEWVIKGLKEAKAKGFRSPEFVSMIYLFYALRDHLTYDIVTNLIWNRWSNKQREISREDILSMLDEACDAQPRIQRWAESSRLKLASNILTALRDFGVLEGSRKKRIVQPVLPLFTAEQILRVLITEGFRGREVLEHATWRLFLCSEEDVADVLARLAQTKRVKFERTGNIIVLQTPESWKEV